MTSTSRRRSNAARARKLAALMLLGTVAVLAGCATRTSPLPTQPGSTPTLAPTPGPSPDAGGCPVRAQAGALRSNTLANLATRSDGLSDIVTFTLGEPASNPAGSGTGELKAVAPPFTTGGSGAEVQVLGAHHVEVKLTQMAITDDNGTPTYAGKSSIKPSMLALKQVEMTEAFEGVYRFVIGYDGNGCVGLTSDPATKTLTITIGH